MKYKFLDHTADVLFEAYGKNLDELFTNTALATEEVMVELKTVSPKLRKEVKLKANSVDNLLFDFVEELIYLKDANLFLFNTFKIKVKEENSSYSLEASCKGEKINHRKHKLGRDVKAITLHEFEVKKGKNWKARVLLDI